MTSSEQSVTSYLAIYAGHDGDTACFAAEFPGLSDTDAIRHAHASYPHWVDEVRMDIEPEGFWDVMDNAGDRAFEMLREYAVANGWILVATIPAGTEVYKQ